MSGRTRVRTDRYSLRGARLLVLNWRDPRHPQAGGAEQYIHEIARRWTADGADVTWFTACVPGLDETEVIDGIRIVRGGGDLSLYARAALWMGRNKTAFDAVVDCQNGIPFFAPAFVGRGTPVVQVVHHVHQDQFATRFSPPLAAIGRALEGPVSRRVYAGRPMVAVSPSTRYEMRKRLGARGPVYIVPNGTVDLPETTAVRSPEPRVAIVTRLAPHKRLDIVLGEIALVARRVPELRLDLVGGGVEGDRLRALTHELGIQDVVTFHGRVPDAVRDEILSRAWLTMSTSASEGWGCSVLEAAAWGIPCLALRVPGIRDSVVDGVTGWLVDSPGDLGDTLESALAQLADPVTAAEVATSCREWAAAFSWDRSATLLGRVVLQAADSAGRRSDRRGARPDISIHAVFDPPVGVDLEAAFRRTDEVTRTAGRAEVVLHGCDEADAAVALGRIGVRRPQLRLSDNRTLLIGPRSAQPLIPAVRPAAHVVAGES